MKSTFSVYLYLYTLVRAVGQMRMTPWIPFSILFFHAFLLKILSLFLSLSSELFFLSRKNQLFSLVNPEEECEGIFKPFLALQKLKTRAMLLCSYLRIDLLFNFRMGSREIKSSSKEILTIYYSFERNIIATIKSHWEDKMAQVFSSVDEGKSVNFLRKLKLFFNMFFVCQ